MSGEQKITMVHGSGGRATEELIGGIFARAFDNATLNQMEDSAVVPGAEEIAITTDSFVVTPLFFRGGDIGRLSVCGTVNDLLMRGAVPKYLTCGFILEEGLSVDILTRAVQSMAATAREAGVEIVAGDTKVVNGKGGMYINTAGVGVIPAGTDIRAANAKPGDTILVSGNLGDHHAAILSERMEIRTDIQSDAAPLSEMVSELRKAGLHIHTMRDVTRGGLATVLKELAVSSGEKFRIREEGLPVSGKVRDFTGLLGLDPLYMGNEGKMTVILPAEEADKALNIIRRCRYGENACRIGEVLAPGPAETGLLVMETELGGERELDVLQGEGLPRIC